MAGTSTENPRTDAARERTGHDAPPARERPVVGGRSIDKDARTRAYVAALQRDLNRHLILLGSPTVLAVDGLWDHDTDVAFRPRLPRARPRAQAQRAHVPRGRRRDRAAHRGGAGEVAHGRRGLREAAAPPLRARAVPKPKPKPDPEPHGRRRAEAALRKAGARYEDAIVREAKRSGLPVSLICAVLEVETGFRNVFGHDNVRNPIKSPPRGLLAVTPDLYRQYLGFRRQGLGNQGVGPMQLTSPGLQDRADALGGCWKVGANIRVGVEFLAGNIQRLGLFGGVAAYNGSNAYADQGAAAGEAVAREARRRRRRPAAAAAARGRCAWACTAPTCSRSSGSINQRFAEWKVGLRIAEDGDFGPDTRKAARRVAYGLGAADRRVRQRHHARAALEAAPPEPPHERGPGPRAAPAPLAAQAARRQQRLGHLPARRARPDHRHALPRHPHARELAVRQRARHPDPQRHAGDRARRRRDREDLQGRVRRDRRLAGDPARREQRVVLRPPDHGHVKAGDHVRKGQTIGTSGSANGVPHLHIGQQFGTPDFH